MNQKELKELIDFLIEKDISEFELERGDVKVRIKRGAASVPVVSYVAPAVSQSAPGVHSAQSAATVAVSAEPPPVVDQGLHMVKSPIVGTFYEAPGPGALPFVKPGDMVKAGQVLCIIE